MTVGIKKRRLRALAAKAEPRLTRSSLALHYARQIEAARIAITRHVKRGGQVWTRIFPDKPITKKPAETRMGKGKGEPEYWAAVVKPGMVLFEIAGVPEAAAKDVLRLWQAHPSYRASVARISTRARPAAEAA